MRSLFHRKGTAGGSNPIRIIEHLSFGSQMEVLRYRYVPMHLFMRRFQVYDYVHATFECSPMAVA